MQHNQTTLAINACACAPSISMCLSVDVCDFPKDEGVVSDEACGHVTMRVLWNSWNRLRKCISQRIECMCASADACSCLSIFVWALNCMQSG
jgi:hypothetical protein